MHDEGFSTKLLSALLILCALALVASLNASAAKAPATVTKAVADPARPAEDRDADARRKPAEMLAFAGVKPGDRVGELIPGKGYFTRLFSAAVGPKGKVYAVAQPRRPNAPEGSPDPAAPVQAIAQDPHYGNVTVVQARATEFTLPEPVDLVWTSQNYHDFHNVPNVDMKALNRRVFDSLKPGGTYVVLDHSAKAGSGFADTSTLHRIDEQAVKDEVVAAGFEYVGRSDVLANADDARDLKVFDEAIRGRTDQFVLKFRRPVK
jgi:predicted methyltransferase